MGSVVRASDIGCTKPSEEEATAFSCITDEETEAQRCKVTWPMEPESETRLLGSGRLGGLGHTQGLAGTGRGPRGALQGSAPSSPASDEELGR